MIIRWVICIKSNNNLSLKISKFSKFSSGKKLKAATIRAAMVPVKNNKLPILKFDKKVYRIKNNADAKIPPLP